MLLEQLHPLTALLLATSMLGACAGILGCFTLLRSQSLFGDAMAHASLPGVAITFMLTSSTNPVILLLGGSFTSLLAALLMHGIQTKTRLKVDAILGSLLSFFFGVGLVLMTIMQRSCSAQQAVLGKFLFGNAALLLHSDMYTILIIGGGIITCVLLFFKELMLFTFDGTAAKSMGYSTRMIDILLICLLVLLIGIGMQTVGIMLITALLIAPAAAARQWTRHLHTMTILSALFGIIATCVGTILSYNIQTLPTGPAIIVVATLIACVSLICGQKRT